MVIDPFAAMAILRREPEASMYAAMLEDASVRLIFAVLVLEAGILAEGHKGEEGALELYAFIGDAALEVVAFDCEQATVSREAFRRYGGSSSRQPELR